MKVLIQATASILIVLAAVVSSHARPQVTDKVALKVIEFPYPGYDTLTAYLDDFAIRYLGDPATRAAVLVYGSGKGLPGVDHRHLREIRNYFVMYKDIAPERLVLLIGGLSVEPGIELWVLPFGTDAPKPATEGVIDRRDYSTAIFAGAFRHKNEEL